jgi:hypothetical protein
MQVYEKQRKGFKKQPTNPNAFCYLPFVLTESQPRLSNRGVRIELAVLSGFFYHWSLYQNGTREKTLEYHDGDVQNIPTGQFLVSALTVAQDLYHRWYGVPDVDFSSGDFEAFYQRVRRATARLMADDLLVRHEMIGHSGRKGSLWSLPWATSAWAGKSCIMLEAANGRILQSLSPGVETKETEHGWFVNMVDQIGYHLVSGKPAQFDTSEFVTTIYKRGRYHNTMNAVNTVSRRGASGPRHISIGQWRKEDIGAFGPREDAPCMVPWVVLDVDGDTVLYRGQRVPYSYPIRSDGQPHLP